VLRLALQINGANEQAKTLLDRINTELRKSQTNPQILDILDRGKTFLREGRIPDAIAAGEAALKIDATFFPTKEFIAEVQKTADQTRGFNTSSESAKDPLSHVEMTQTTERIERFGEPVAGSRSTTSGKSAGSQQLEKSRTLPSAPARRIENVAPPRQPGAGGILRRRPLFVGLALAALVLIVAIVFWVRGASARRKIALLNHAEQLENQKLWPQALSEYETVAQGQGATAQEAQQRGDSLKKLIDQEASLWNQATQLEASGKVSGAVAAYRQIAALHGDREAGAQAAAEKLSGPVGNVTEASVTGNKSPSAACRIPICLVIWTWPKRIEPTDSTRTPSANITRSWPAIREMHGPAQAF
jgi:hypothetical protein